MDQLWANRAASAEAAIAERHIRRLWQLPGTQLGVVGWPPTRRDSWFGSWHYWWQAHLLDCLVDAQERDPQPARLASIKRQIRGHRLRNNGRWTNSYYDDMAWLALSLERRRRSPVSPAEGPKSSAISSSIPGCPRTAAESPGASRTSSSTLPLTDPPESSWRASVIACAVRSRWRIDRRNADRPRHQAGVRRYQGRFTGSRPVHLPPGCGGGAGDGTGGADLRRAPRCQGCAADRCDPETHGPGRCPERRRGR